MAKFIFNISKGIIAGPAGNWTAWSGHGEGINNPQACNQKGIGPLPPGLYSVGWLQPEHEKLGPNVMALTRIDGGETYGRGGFYIHGASWEHPELSSDGCIILTRERRLAMDNFMKSFGDRQLLVIARK